MNIERLTKLAETGDKAAAAELARLGKRNGSPRYAAFSGWAMEVEAELLERGQALADQMALRASRLTLHAYREDLCETIDDAETLADQAVSLGGFQAIADEVLRGLAPYRTLVDQATEAIDAQLAARPSTVGRSYR